MPTAFVTTQTTIGQEGGPKHSWIDIYVNNVFLTREDFHGDKHVQRCQDREEKLKQLLTNCGDPPDPDLAAFRESVKEHYIVKMATDDMDLDKEPFISASEGGAYVQAWLWVDRPAWCCASCDGYYRHSEKGEAYHVKDNGEPDPDRDKDHEPQAS